MANPFSWIDLLATTKAVFESTKAEIDFAAALLKYRQDDAIKQEAQRGNVEFPNFEDEDLQAITMRVQECYRANRAAGEGAKRAKCLCGELKRVANENGGQLPKIGDWQDYYRQLGCGSKPAN
jgi:hypothetical protein